MRWPGSNPTPSTRPSWRSCANTDASIELDVGGLDDRGPARDLALQQRGERLLAAFFLAGNVGAEIDEPLAHVLVVQGLVESIGETVEDGVGRGLGREEGEPGRRLVLR